MLCGLVLLLGLGGGLRGGLQPTTPGRIWALGQSSPGIKDPGLAREQAETLARANLARVAAAMAGLALPGRRLSATLKGSEISSIECSKICVARAEAPLEGVEVKRGDAAETLEDVVAAAFASDRERAMHALGQVLARQKPDRGKPARRPRRR